MSNTEPTYFTQREVTYVTCSWNVIRPAMMENGLDLFINFFATFPEYQTIFPSLVDIRLDKLRQSHALQMHAESVMLAVSVVVDNLQVISALKPLMTRLGGIHARNKVPAKALMDFKLVFIHWLRMKLGPKATKSTMAAWDKTLSVLVLNLLQGIASEATSGLSVASAAAKKGSSMPPPPPPPLSPPPPPSPRKLSITPPPSDRKRSSATPPPRSVRNWSLTPSPPPSIRKSSIAPPPPPPPSNCDN